METSSAYLFVHFSSDKSDRESIWFSVSRDGLHWKDLGGDVPFLTSKIGTKGVRDPFMIYDETLKKYFIIATDLNTNDGGDWYDFSHRGSRSILIWESDDLINWSNERLVPLAIEGAGCAWAPEAVFCRERGEWMIFFASCVEDKHRIFAAFTKDFRTFGDTFEYINNDKDIIDTSIVWNDGYYYRFSKDEVTKTITIQRAKELLSDSFETLYCKALDGYEGLEGPEIFYIDGLGKWCLIVDRYSGNHGYLPLLADSLEKADFRILSDGEYNLGKRKKRHGGVIKITEEQCRSLEEHIGE